VVELPFHVVVGSRQLELDLRFDAADDEAVLGRGADIVAEVMVVAAIATLVGRRTARRRRGPTAGQRERSDEREGHAEEDGAVCYGTPLRCG